MSVRRRFVLPPVLLVVSAALIASNRLRPYSLDPPTSWAPDFQFCLAINAPAAAAWLPLRSYAWSHFWLYLNPRQSDVLEMFAFFILIGLFWYAVGVELDGRGLSLLTPRTRVRRLADVSAMAFGAIVAVNGWGMLFHGFGVVTAYSSALAAPRFLWAGVIIAFYAHDLWSSFTESRKSRHAGGNR